MFYRNVLAISCFLLFISHAVADDSQRHQQVGGMDVYLGVIPAQLTQEHPKMHGGASSKEHRYHVLIALFDSESGKRITEAEVTATVSPLGRLGKKMTLGPMHGKALTFGNYFTLHKPELYRIKVKIKRDKEASVMMANFVYQRPRD